MPWDFASDEGASAEDMFNSLPPDLREYVKDDNEKFKLEIQAWDAEQKKRAIQQQEQQRLQQQQQIQQQQQAQQQQHQAAASGDAGGMARSVDARMGECFTLQDRWTLCFMCVGGWVFDNFSMIPGRSLWNL